MEKRFGNLTDTAGNAISGATVTVQTYPGGSTALIYRTDDATGTAISNGTLTTDSKGYYEYYAPNGSYSETYSGTGIQTYTISDISISDDSASLAALAASSGSSLVGFIQSGTGATARTLQAKSREIFSVTDFGATGDGSTDDSAAIILAISAGSGKTVYFPNPTSYYKLGAGLGTIPANTRLQGANRATCKIQRAFAGTQVMTLAEGVALDNLYLEGDGATYAGKGIVIGSTDGKQNVTDCKIINFDGNCIEFTSVNAGSQSNFVNVETWQTNGSTTSGKYAIVNEDAVQLSAVPKSFHHIETAGKCSFDFGGSNDVFITNSFIADINFSANTRSAHLTGSRLANQTALTIRGANSTIAGCDLLPTITIASGTTSLTMRGNTYNNLPIVDSANSTSNEIELTGIVDRQTFRVESGGAPMAFTASDTTPSVAGRTYWQTANGSSTTITNFDDGHNGQLIVVRLDANTGITHGSSNIRLRNSVSIPVGFYSANDLIAFFRFSSIWFELWRTDSSVLRSATYDPANLVDGAGVTTTVTCVGAALGDIAIPSFSLDLQGITLTAYVSAADTVSVRFQNETGGPIDLGSGTLRVEVRKSV